MPQYHESEFDDQSLTCPSCEWNGKGTDAIVIRLYGITKLKAVHCPKCDTLLGELETATMESRSSDPGDEISNQLGQSII